MEHNIELGQHFMVDNDLLDRIINASYIDDQDIILEIGPGSGNLTKKLLTARPKHIICVEQDERFSAVNSSTEFIHANILDVIDDIACTAVVANIPYHISEPLTISILKKEIPKIVMVVGRTFADVITGNTILGRVLTHLYTVEVLEYISPQAFSPPPNVDSALIRLRIKQQEQQDLFLEQFYFFQTSKVKNMLLSICEGTLTKKEVKERLTGLSVQLQDKPLYTLSTEEFLIVHQFFKDNFINDK